MKKNRNKKRNTIYAVAFSGMLSALSVVILSIAVLFEFADVATAIFSSFLVLFMQIEFSSSYAFTTYGVTSIVSFLLLPSKLSCFYYIILYGWYPPVKLFMESRIQNKKLCFAVKTMLIGISVVLQETFYRSLFGYTKNNIMTVVIVSIFFVTFFFYDALLLKLKYLYQKHWRRHIFRH